LDVKARSHAATISGETRNNQQPLPSQMDVNPFENIAQALGRKTFRS
jgi:hypothetical protein